MKAQRVFVGKGLAWTEARAKAKEKAARDWRGMSYNKATGYATLT
jgi:hypothetical protein